MPSSTESLAADKDRRGARVQPVRGLGRRPATRFGRQTIHELTSGPGEEGRAGEGAGMTGAREEATGPVGATAQRWIAGLDIGGTFTDVYMVEAATGRVHRFKSLTTPEDPARGAVEALRMACREAGAAIDDAAIVMHATTLVSNALIERKGAKTALVATGGFADLLEIAREKKYDIYDLGLEKAAPLVAPGECYELAERIAADGSVVEPLDEAEADAVIEAIARSGARAVAVCLLHSYANPHHERLFGELLAARLPGVACSLSSDLLPEMREYERATGTTANAYVLPLVRQYLARLEDGLPSRLFVMLSSGGITTPDIAGRFPVRLCESGPAAGAVMAADAGRSRALPHILSFDMGGTTAKTCLIENGAPIVTTEFEVARQHRFKKGSGLPLRMPVVDMIEIGAGGGSIARVDDLGLLKVGPESAGADPGPACYGRGGTLPTVTDADLVLGYLASDAFLGGTMRLDGDKARCAIRDRIAEPLGLSVEEAALGIHAVVDEMMANAARIHAVERGFDPADHVLVAFGGAGPVHAEGVARRLGIDSFIVPGSAGVGSALGLLLAPRAYRLSRTLIGTVDAIDWTAVERAFRDMAEDAAAVLKRAGVPRTEIAFSRIAEMRYLGQRMELAVRLPDGDFGPGRADTIRAAFETEYERVYRRIHAGHPVEARTWRLVAEGPPIVGSVAAPSASGEATPPIPRRTVWLEGSDTPCPAQVYKRDRVPEGCRIPGPAIIEDSHTTIVVGPGSAATSDGRGNLAVDLGRGGHGEA